MTTGIVKAPNAKMRGIVVQIPTLRDLGDAEDIWGSDMFGDYIH